MIFLNTTLDWSAFSAGLKLLRSSAICFRKWDFCMVNCCSRSSDKFLNYLRLFTNALLPLLLLLLLLLLPLLLPLQTGESCGSENGHDSTLTEFCRMHSSNQLWWESNLRQPHRSGNHNLLFSAVSGLHGDDRLMVLSDRYGLNSGAHLIPNWKTMEN